MKPGPRAGDAEKRRNAEYRDYLKRNIAAWVLITKRRWTVSRAARKLQLSEAGLKQFIDANFADLARRLDERAKIDAAGS